MKKFYLRMKYPVRKAVLSILNPLTWLRGLIEEPRLKFDNYLSVCAIAKNEGSYLKEWIDFHRLVGVDKFYIYDNCSTDNTREVLDPYVQAGVVEYTFVPGRGRQRWAYRDCIRRHKYDTKWLAFIDIDEFIVPVETGTVSDFLRGLPGDVSQLSIGWSWFGSSGHDRRPAGLVIENFQHRAREVGSIGKSIVNPRRILRNSISYSIVLGRSVDENGDTFLGTHMEKSAAKDRIRLHHYGVKSWEEFSMRAGRGDGMRRDPKAGERKYTKAYFDSADVNEVHDRIMDKWVRRL